MKVNLNEKQIFANNLKFLLRKKKLNYKEFAKAINIKYTTVLDWVNARTFPRIEKLEIIAKYFAVQKSVLLDERMPSLISVLDLEQLLNDTLKAINNAENISYKEMKLDDTRRKVVTSTLNQIIGIFKEEYTTFKKFKEVEQMFSSLTTKQDPNK